MKKVILILAVLVFSSGFLWADGFGLDSRITFDSNNETNLISTSISLRPYFSIMLDDATELTPFLLFSMDYSRTSGTVDDRYSIGGGTGVYFHFVQGKIIDLSTGANLSAAYTWHPDLYFGIDLNVGVPVVLDIKLSESFLIRISLTIAQLSFYYMNINMITTSGVLISYSNTITTSARLKTFWTSLSPTFGFMFQF